MSKPITVSFHISGMHCASCAANIQRALSKEPGIINVSVNYANEQGWVKFKPAQINFQTITKTIAKLGYQAHLETDPAVDLSALERQTELQSLKQQLIIGGGLTLLLLFSMLPGLMISNWLLLLLATPIQFWLGKRFYQGALAALKNHTSSMDTLVVLGTSVAYFYSIIVVLFNLSLYTYFETSAVIITLILLGKYLEIKAKGQASEAIKKLLSLQVKSAHLITQDNKIVDTPIDQLQPGDHLLIKPGEKIPLDGQIINGTSYLDESLVTGESLPITKTIGDQVIGATLNTSGALEIIVQKVGQDTLLAQIIALVKNAQASRPAIQNLVDQISSYFVPVVIVLALITFVAWFIFGPQPSWLVGLINMISVLIIACPCALGLAIPTSLIVAIGRGAKEGILIKDAHVLEIAPQVKTIVFDKTGTLTQGRPQVEQVKFTSNLSKIKQLKIWILVKTIEQSSQHPLAQAIVNYIDSLKLKANPPKLTHLTDLPGLGIKAQVGKDEILIGTPALLQQHQVETNQLIKPSAHTQVFVSLNQQLVLVLAIADTLRANAKPVITQLKNRHFVPVMLTGDNLATAKKIANQLGIDQLKAQILPKDKAQAVKNLHQPKRLVAMVGDGINDAPALASADLSIAMGNGTDVAIESAHLVLLRSDLTLIPKALRLSQLTMTNIKQNLIWAFGYNIILIPVAMAGFINPIFAGAAMAFSSVSVVTNALRLKRSHL